MKVIKNSKLNPKESASSPMGDVIGSIKSGLNLSEGIQAEDAVIASLERMLDNRYVILRDVTRDVTLPGLRVPIPLVLLGPTGVRVLNPSSKRGIYRAQGENWEQMDDRRQDFKPAQPNLIMRAQLMARAVEKFLTGQGYELPEVEPVLVFTEPGVHIETVRPVVRVILIDGLERFTAGLAQGYPILEKEDVQKIADLFSDSMGLKNLDASAYPKQDVFSFTDEEAETNPSWLDQIPAGEGIVSTLNKIPFSSRQWLLLGTMMIVNVFVLLTFILLVLVS
jgi:hypothetical protein